MGKKKIIAEPRARAAKYRSIGRQTTDDQAAHEAFALAAELEQQARDLEQVK